MEFYLVYNRKLLFLGDKENNISTNLITRNTENKTIAELMPVVKNYATEALTEHLHKKLFKPIDNDQITWDLYLKIELPSVLPADDKDEDESIHHTVRSMKLHTYGENSFLNRIGNMIAAQNEVSTVDLKLIVNDFGPYREVGEAAQFQSTIAINWESQSERLNFSESDEDASTDVASLRFHSYCDLFWCHNLKEDMTNAWKNGEDFQGSFTIQLVLPEKLVNMLMLPEQPHFAMFRKMLDNKIEWDMKLVASNGLTVKCHRALIAAYNEKLADLLKKEPGKLVSFMDNLTQRCIKALLEYVYCKDITRATCNAFIATQVLEAALQFEMNDLTEVMKKVLLVRPNQWYGVDEALNMFLLAITMGLKKGDSSTSEEDLSVLEDDSSTTKEISGDLENISSGSEDGLSVLEDDGVEIQQGDCDEDGDKDSSLIISEDELQTDDTCEWEPLKKRAVEVLKWYSKNRYKELMASSRYRQLFQEDPQVAMEVGKLFLQLG